MKKIGILLLALVFGGLTFASFVNTTTPPKATEIFLPLGNNHTVSLKDLSQMKVKEYELLSGKHLNIFQKISFKLSQRKLRKAISADNTVNTQKISNMMAGRDFTDGFNGGWFALGILTGLIGVLLSYIIPGAEEVRKNRQKWAWLGLGVVVAIVLLALIL
ncbi:MAG: hypothetical protein J0H55_08765 [Chitinophagaceae bacterium]|nr:hypothetical protein [Chitinophagaceae bacterium]